MTAPVLSEVISRTPLPLGLELPDGVVVETHPRDDGLHQNIVCTVLDDDRRYLEAKRRMADHLINREAV